ncbi:MAG: hypothetical protein AVDCRST_MAG71-2215, partial [uncultured Lysobacter sp.]
WTRGQGSWRCLRSPAWASCRPARTVQVRQRLRQRLALRQQRSSWCGMAKRPPAIPSIRRWRPQAPHARGGWLACSRTSPWLRSMPPASVARRTPPLPSLALAAWLSARTTREGRRSSSLSACVATIAAAPSWSSGTATPCRRSPRRCARAPSRRCPKANTDVISAWLRRPMVPSRRSCRCSAG